MIDLGSVRVTVHGSTEDGDPLIVVRDPVTGATFWGLDPWGKIDWQMMARACSRERTTMATVLDALGDEWAAACEGWST